MQTSPDQIGPYRLTGLLAQGGMGVVHTATDDRDGAHVALKTVFSVEPSHVAGIRRESETLARLRHPNVVRVLDSGVHEGTPWCAMELLEGRTLRHFIEEHRREAPVDAPPARLTTLPVEDALELVQRMCEPLAFLHGEGIVHRDLKPSNVFLRDPLDPVLVDFGLVQRFGGPTARENLEESDGPPGGTYLYISPEQLAEGVVDPRTDLYALGCILYELLVGRPPFRGSVPQLILHHLQTVPAPPSAADPSLPKELDVLVAGLLAKQPADRIGYAADVAATIAGILERDFGREQPARVDDVPRPRDYLYRPDLAGRKRILENVHAALDDPSQRLILIRGESGVGKTRIAAELARHARVDDIRVVRGSCQPLFGARVGVSAGTPLHPFRSVLRHIGDHCRASGPSETRRVLGTRAGVLAMYEPSLEDIEGLSAQTAIWLPTVEASRQRLYSWLAETLTAFARDAPILLLIDDVQWADELTRGFLVAVASDTSTLHRVNLVCTCRLGSDVEQELVGLPGSHEVQIGPLDADEVRELVGDMLARREPPETLVARLVELSGGNPFYVGEYLHAAVDKGVLRRDAEGRWILDEARSPAVDVPGSIEELAAFRIDAHGQAASTLLEEFATFGGDVSTELLARISSAAEAEVLAMTGELIARDVVTEAMPGTLQLRHETLRAAIYGRIPEDRRRSLHRRIAEVLEDGRGAPHELARHWDGSGDSVRAMAFYLRAGLEAQARAAPRQARDLLERGFSLERETGATVERTTERARIELAYAEALYGTGQIDQSADALRDLLGTLGVRIPDSRAGWGTTIAKEGAAQARRRWVPSLSGGKRRETDALALRALDTLASIFLARADTMGQMGLALIGSNLAELAGDGAEAAMGHSRMGLFVGLAGMEGPAERYLARARASASAGGVPLPPRVHMAEALICLVRARWRHLDDLLDPAVEACRESGDFLSEVQIVLFCAGAAVVRGQADRCLELVDRALSVTEQHGYELERTHLLGNRAAAHVHRRDPDAAGDALDVLDAMLSEQTDPVARAVATSLRACAWLQSGEPRPAETTADAALATLAEAPSGSPGYVVPYMYLTGVVIGLAQEGADMKTHATTCLGGLKAQARMQPAARPMVALYEGVLARLEGRRGARRRLENAAKQARETEIPWVEMAAHYELSRLGGTSAAAELEHARSIASRAGVVFPPFYVA